MCDLNLYISLRFRFIFETVTWHRRLVADLSSFRPDFNPRSVFVRFVMGNGAVGNVFLREGVCVYCAVRTESLYIFEVQIHL
jgi:hypothetical protein